MSCISEIRCATRVQIDSRWRLLRLYFMPFFLSYILEMLLSLFQEKPNPLKQASQGGCERRKRSTNESVHGESQSYSLRSEFYVSIYRRKGGAGFFPFLPISELGRLYCSRRERPLGK